MDVLNTTSGAYRYQPLNLAQTQIRLFRLRNTQSGDALTGALEVHVLEAAPPFKALSYIWGPTGGEKDLIVDGRMLQVRSNLYDFLVSYQTRTQVYYTAAFCEYSDYAQSPNEAWLWIDQLCIDQQNHQERSHQVRLMGAIYRQARQVVTWLGQDDQETQQAFEAIKADITDRIGYPREINAMSIIDQNPYWSRLWIIQEIRLAKCITFMCGSTYLRLQQMHTWTSMFGCDEIMIMEKPTKVLYPLLQNFESSSIFEHPYVEFLHGMQFCKNECSDPRDEFYGLLGLAGEEELLLPDYDKSVAEVFAEAVAFVVHLSSSMPGVSWNITFLIKALDSLGKEMGLIHDNNDRARFRGHDSLSEYFGTLAKDKDAPTAWYHDKNPLAMYSYRPGKGK
ncbi:heterokaryon incompatibility protein-domain-containing protein [Bisporella sp. PMI_857]|nr:heterokaryon incompatibility protein-domain-containing protein [Bisporella sp. PMI_857]